MFLYKLIGKISLHRKLAVRNPIYRFTSSCCHNLTFILQESHVEEGGVTYWDRIARWEFWQAYIWGKFWLGFIINTPNWNVYLRISLLV